jgi:tetratricopeptide (TPR) repeat protein
MGIVYRSAKKLDRAVKCFDLSLILNADQPWVNALRGETLLATGDAARALPDFDVAVAGLPGFNADITQANRALARERTGDFAGAIADLTAVLERSPHQADVLFQRSRVRNKNRDAGGAKADLAELLKSTPVTVRGWIARALAQPEAAKALADLEQALKLDPLSESALQNRANILAERLNRPDEAIAALDQLLKQFPDSAHALAGRGVLLARRGERDSAVRDAQAALAAGIYAQTSKKEPADLRQALLLLAEAFRREPSLVNLVVGDRDLDPIRTNDKYLRILDAARVLLTQDR